MNEENIKKFFEEIGLTKGLENMKKFQEEFIDKYYIEKQKVKEVLSKDRIITEDGSEILQILNQIKKELRIK